MFEVYKKNPTTLTEKELGTKFKKMKVYAVHSKNGYPFFTFYEDKQWVTRSAKNYIPCKEGNIDV